MTDEEVFRTCADGAIGGTEGCSFGILNDGTKLACLADWRIIEGWANAMPVAGQKLSSAEGRSVQFFRLPAGYVFPLDWHRIVDRNSIG